MHFLHCHVTKSINRVISSMYLTAIQFNKNKINRDHSKSNHDNKINKINRIDYIITLYQSINQLNQTHIIYSLTNNQLQWNLLKTKHNQLQWNLLKTNSFKVQNEILLKTK